MSDLAAHRGLAIFNISFPIYSVIWYFWQLARTAVDTIVNTGSHLAKTKWFVNVLRSCVRQVGIEDDFGIAVFEQLPCLHHKNSISATYINDVCLRQNGVYFIIAVRACHQSKTFHITAKKRVFFSDRFDIALCIVAGGSNKKNIRIPFIAHFNCRVDNKSPPAIATILPIAPPIYLGCPQIPGFLSKWHLHFSKKE